MLLDDLDDYKNSLMEEFCKDENIVRLLTKSSKVSVPNYDLPYNYIFPFEFIPETVDKAMSFLCFDVDINGVGNKTVYYPVIYVWVFTHKSNMRIPNGGGVRTDKMASAVDHILNGSRIYGMGELEFSGISSFTPIRDYLGRALVYTTKEWNRTAANKKKTPSHRKSL